MMQQLGPTGGAQGAWLPPRIVKAKDLEVAILAHDLLAQARAQARNIVLAAESEAAIVRAESVEHAAAEAQRGYAEGTQRAEREFALRMARSDAEGARHFVSQEERMSVLVTRTLEKVLSEAQNDERFFAGVMSRILRAARDEKYLTVRVCAEQREAAQSAIRGLLDQAAATNFIEVVGDADLRRGTCIVESAHGVIDASLDTQLDVIREALLAAWGPTRG